MTEAVFEAVQVRLRQRFNYLLQGAVEPMQVDAPPEENENVEEEHFVVETTNLVSCVIVDV